MNILNAYFQYRWKSLFIVRKKNDFVCSIDDSERKSRHKIGFEENLAPFREVATTSNRTIEIKDFGAGSKKLGSIRRIKSIYKTSVANRKWQRLMYHMIRKEKARNILEMGTSLGFSTVYLGKATRGKVTTIEACPATHAEAEVLFKATGTENILSINDTFSNFFLNHSGDKFDFVYVDGHHDGQAILEYVKQLKSIMKNGAIVLVDDIRWSDGMYLAWEALLQDSDFSNKIDLFRMGILKFQVK